MNAGNWSESNLFFCLLRFWQHEEPSGMPSMWYTPFSQNIVAKSTRHFEKTVRKILLWDPLQRSSVDISYTHLVQIASLTRGSCTAASTRNLSRRFARDLLLKKKRRELAKSNVTSLLPEAMFTEHNVFTTSVAFALLVCDHWWFWVLFNFPRKTTYCLGPIAGIILHSVGVYLKILWEQGNQPTNQQPENTPPPGQDRPKNMFVLMMLFCCLSRGLLNLRQFS